MTTWIVIIELRGLHPIEAAMAQSVALNASHAMDLTLVRGGMEVEFAAEGEARLLAGKVRRLGATAEVLRRN